MLSVAHGPESLHGPGLQFNLAAACETARFTSRHLAAADPSLLAFSVVGQAGTDYSPRTAGRSGDGQGPLVGKGMELEALKRLVTAGESESVEFKKSTAEITRVGETLCAFLNGHGGTVLIGVAPDGRLLGQMVSDSTLRDIAGILDRFEPPVKTELERVAVDDRHDVLVLTAPSAVEDRPYVWGGRPYRRVGTTTSRMPQAQYERLLLDRAYVRHRWENQPAVGVTLEDLDREEILRTRELAVRQNRVSAGTSLDPGEILDRLKLREKGVILRAAHMLYGTRFSSDYPQTLLKLGRFRGTTITGDILDNRQDHMHAFAMVREAMAWLERTMPLSARFPVGRIEREDRFPVPTSALREAILNAAMHRDYSNPSGYVAVAVFDDRIEVRSIGRLPTGITAADLSGPHDSNPPNPLIAEAFHRTGAVEVWGRGTNRVIDECLRHGIEAPTFEERGGAVIVTFRAEITPGTKQAPSGYQVGTQSGLGRSETPQVTLQVTPQVTLQVTPQVRAVLSAGAAPCSRAELQRAAGLKDRMHFTESLLQPLLAAGLLEMTLPDTPRSSRQRYRTTKAGARALEKLAT
jgi:ATP-dependent DNA helicase RecG